MDILKRQIDSYIWDEEIIGDKMIFLSGPRQIGKTTYVKNLLATRFKGSYFNWDNPKVRKNYTEDPFFFIKQFDGSSFLVIFDEIHKRPRWKDILKGAYDSIDKKIRLLITGSARLEWFRKSGDSLIGRYTHFHLLTLSLSEVLQIPYNKLWLCNAKDWTDPAGSLINKIENGITDYSWGDTFNNLFYFGGFPEPLFRSSDRFLRKWQSDYISLILTEDLREITAIKDIDRMEKIALLLPERVGSPLSISSLARDVESNYHTVKNSIMQLERLWFLFSIQPWSKKLHRTLTKEAKTYFTNWIYAKNEAQKYENLIASHLIKACNLWKDSGYGNAEVWYIRNFDGNEVDFLITINDSPCILIEAKLTQTTISKPTINFSEKLEIPVIQIINQPGIFKKIKNNLLVLSVEKFLGVIP